MRVLVLYFMPNKDTHTIEHSLDLVLYFMLSKDTHTIEHLDDRNAVSCIIEHLDDRNAVSCCVLSILFD